MYNFKCSMSRIYSKSTYHRHNIMSMHFGDPIPHFWGPVRDSLRFVYLNNLRSKQPRSNFTGPAVPSTIININIIIVLFFCLFFDNSYWRYHYFVFWSVLFVSNLVYYIFYTQTLYQVRSMLLHLISLIFKFFILIIQKKKIRIFTFNHFM